MRLYFYCIMKDFRGGKLPVQGMNGQRIFQIRSGTLFAAVSASPVMRVDPSDAHLRKHHRIIRDYMRAYPILPFRFNTIVGESVGRGVLRKYHTQLVRDLHRVRGHMQFSVCVARPLPGDPRSEMGSLLSPSELKARMQTYLGTRRTPRKRYVLKREVYVREIHGPLSAHATEVSDGRLHSQRQLINRHYLVPSEKTAVFKRTVRTLLERFPELEFVVGDPEPPYDFHSTSIMLSNSHPGKHTRRG